jgi:hypothetical protein
MTVRGKPHPAERSEERLAASLHPNPARQLRNIGSMNRRV